MKITQPSNIRLRISFLIATLLIAFLYLGNLGLGTATTLLVTILVLFIAYLEYKRKIFRSLGLKKQNLNYKSVLIKAPITALLIVVMYKWFLTPIIINITKVEIDLFAFRFNTSRLASLIITIL